MSLTCLLLPGAAPQHRQGSENLTPFLRVIDNNFLERPFIPGLQTSFEYLWRFSSITSLMNQVTRGRPILRYLIFPSQSNGSHGNGYSHRNEHFRIPFLGSCDVCDQLKKTLSQLHYFTKLAEILQQKYFLSKTLSFQEKSTFLHLFMGKCQNWMKISNFLMGKFKTKCFIFNRHFDISTLGSVEKSLKCRHFEMSEMSTF